jgi:hypothetical protein
VDPAVHRAGDQRLATIIQTGTSVTAKNLSYNGTPAAAGSIRFGLQGTASGTISTPALTCSAS